MRKKTNRYFDYIAVLIFMVVMFSIPWESIKGVNLPDRERYFNYFLYQENILEYKEINGIIDYVKHEALWHYMISALVDDYSITLGSIMFIITAFCLAVFSVFLVNRAGSLSVILLLSPLLVNLAFSQLRMALAYSLFLVAYMSRRPSVVVICVLPALFIHTAMLIFLGIYLSLKIIEYLYRKKVFGPVLVYIGCFVIGVMISIAIGPLREMILGAVGDRRAGYGDASSSVLYTLYWVGLLGLTAVQRTNFYENETNRYSIIILSLVTMNMITGGYTSRFLAVGLPMLLVTMLDMDRGKKIIATIFYILYLGAQWIYWLKIGLIR